MALPVGRGLDLHDPWGPVQPRHAVILGLKGIIAVWNHLWEGQGFGVSSDTLVVPFSQIHDVFVHILSPAVKLLLAL